jgi:glucose/arabinose dehydrogenase
MRSKSRAAWFALQAILLATLPAGSQTAKNPAFTYTSLMKSGLQPIVGDIEWMPDGRLLVMTMVMKGHDHVSGPSNLLLLDGVLKGGPEAVTVKTYATGFYTPLGLEVVNGQVYVLDNKEGILKLTDADKDDVAEARSVVWSEGIKTADRKWSGGLVSREGFFFVPISTRIVPGGRSDPTQGKWNGTVAKVSFDGKTAEIHAGGLRNSNGISWAPDGSLLVSDNQGDWTPVSRLNEIFPGEFYGHKTTAFDTKPMTPPILWLPQGELANSPSTSVFLERGPYAGQMLIGEVTNQRILRANLERVAGRLQGCVFHFAGNMPAGVQRMLLAPDNSGSIILAGVGGDGGWTFKTPWYDLERLTPSANVPFDMLAVRSLGPASMEVEFTKPIAAADAVPARFSVSTWRYQPTEDYGGPKLDVKNATSGVAVSKVTLSADGKKALLDITGLQAGRVVQIKLVNMKSATGEAPFAVDAYYTLNSFGPGTAMPAVPVSTAPGRSSFSVQRGPWALRNLGSEALVRPPLAEAFTLRILSPEGRVLGTYASRQEGGAWECRVPLAGLRDGRVVLLEARGARGTVRTKWILP